MEDACAWCSSTSLCMDQFDTFATSECQGVVFDPPCPSTFIETTELNGNLVVKGNREMTGGGNILVEGPCSDSGCRNSGMHLLSADGEGIVLKSSGPVTVEAADTDLERKASEFLLRSGDGTSAVGGSGGDFFIFAGDGKGGEYLFFQRVQKRIMKYYH